MLELKERYRIGKKQNREDHRFFSNLHGDNDDGRKHPLKYL